MLRRVNSIKQAGSSVARIARIIAWSRLSANSEATLAVEKKQGVKRSGRKVPFALSDFESHLQQAQREERQQEQMVRDAVSPCGVRRVEYNTSGFVCVADPPVQNARLSSQQGLFVFNGRRGSRV